MGVSGARRWACPVRGEGAQEASGCSLQLHLFLAELSDGGSGHKELKRVELWFRTPTQQLQSGIRDSIGRGADFGALGEASGKFLAESHTFSGREGAAEEGRDVDIDPGCGGLVVAAAAARCPGCHG